jgi:hypothetical protein
MPDGPGNLLLRNHRNLRGHPKGKEDAAESRIHHTGKKIFRGKAFPPGLELHQGCFPDKQRFSPDLRHFAKPYGTTRFEKIRSYANMELRLSSGRKIRKKNPEEPSEQNEKKQKKAGTIPP